MVATGRVAAESIITFTYHLYERVRTQKKWEANKCMFAHVNDKLVVHIDIERKLTFMVKKISKSGYVKNGAIRNRLQPSILQLKKR